MNEPNARTLLPHARRKRRPWGRLFARILSAAFAVFGLVPLFVMAFLKSEWVRRTVAAETSAVLRKEGIVATFRPHISFWPFGLELSDMDIQSTDGGGSAFVADKVLVRPKVFALLSGKVLVDEVELEKPRVRVAIVGGELKNLKLARSESKKKDEPFRPPFNLLSVTDLSLDLMVDDLRVVGTAIDLDITREKVAALDWALEVGMRTGLLRSTWVVLGEGEERRVFSDAICGVDTRVRVEPKGALVRRLTLRGAVDLDPAEDTEPPCNAPEDDERRLQVSMSQLLVRLSPDGLPERVFGHAEVRAPLEVAKRFVDTPPLDGFVSVKADLAYEKGDPIPDVTGSIEGRHLTVDKYAFAEELSGTLALESHILTSPRMRVKMADGEVALEDTRLELDSTKFQTRLTAKDVNFTSLMRDLGVHPNSHVLWDIRKVTTTLLSGTLSPLHVDGDLTADSKEFAIYDKPVKNPEKGRIVSVGEADIVAKIAIRPDALKFHMARVVTGGSVLEQGTVSIGFHNDLRVEVPSATVRLEDLSPLGNVDFQGVVRANVRVGGTFSRPEPVAKIEEVRSLVVADIPFGDVRSGEVSVDVDKKRIDMKGVKATFGRSDYDISTARLEFTSPGFVFDGSVGARAFDLRELLAMFHMEDDPRFAELSASVGARAEIHVGVGNAEDKCGGGYVSLRGPVELSSVKAYGESFEKGAADVDFVWHDRGRGIAGVDLQVRSFSLRKALRGGGAVLGSASIRQGGKLEASVVVDGMSLARLDTLGVFAHKVDGTLMSVAQVRGSLDDFEDGAGIVAKAQVELSPVRIRSTGFGPSRLSLVLTQDMPKQKDVFRRTRCGARVGPPFDRVAYLKDERSHGEIRLSGDLFDGMIHLDPLVMTRQKAPHLRGAVSLKNFDVARLVDVSQDPGPERTPSSLSGKLSAKFTLTDVPLKELKGSHVDIELLPSVVEQRGVRAVLAKSEAPISLRDNTLKVPLTVVSFESGAGVRGGLRLHGNVDRALTDPDLMLTAEILPVDLKTFLLVFPRVDRASGKASGLFQVRGRALDPTVTGELHVTGDDVAVRGLPSPLTGLRVDVYANATDLSATAVCGFAGGTVNVSGGGSIRGLSLGVIDAAVVSRGLRLAPMDGVRTTLDTDLKVFFDPRVQSGNALARVTGDVSLTSFEYTRPISLDLSSAITGRAQRTEVQTYDPSRDQVRFDSVRVLAKAPLRISNNLVDLSLGLDTPELVVTGTNQRTGLRGGLRAVSGGRFRFRAHEFDIRQANIRFDDPARIMPNVDVLAVTEYRRLGDAGRLSGGSSLTAAVGTGAGGGASWRIQLHAYGDAENLKMDMTSEPSLAQEDIALLLAVGMTRAEIDQLQSGSLSASLALSALGTATGADRAVAEAIPVIDDFRFGSGTNRVGNPDPQLTVGRRLTNNLRASVTTGLSENRELRANIEWRLSQKLSLQGSYDNVNAISSSTLGNLGADLRYRLEFE